MVNDFKLWWSNAGSAMQPLPNEDIEEFARRVCELAWRGGEYSERHACAKDASDKIKYRIKQGFPEHGHAVTLQDNIEITAIFTVASIVRGYLVRRAFVKWGRG